MRTEPIAMTRCRAGSSTASAVMSPTKRAALSIRIARAEVCTSSEARIDIVA